jgi:hypothetical protein
MNSAESGKPVKHCESNIVSDYHIVQCLGVLD